MHNGRDIPVSTSSDEGRHTKEMEDDDSPSINIEIDAYSHDLSNLGNKDSHDNNILEEDVGSPESMEAPQRKQTNTGRLFGFASLKTKTFDNNFKDLEGLKRKSELLYLSERYLHSKLYTPKLEALQRLVEPGKCISRTESNFVERIYRVDRAPQIATGETSSDVEYPSKSRSDDSQRDKYANFDVEIDISDTDWDKHDSNKEEGYADRTKYNIVSADTTKQSKESVITVVTSSSVVNGHQKKRIAIPKAAYQPLHDGGKPTNKVVLKVVGNAKAENPHFEWSNDPIRWLYALENHLENVINTMELCGNAIVSPNQVIEQLECIKPEWMPPEVFYLMCLKPVGMDPNEFLELIQDYDIDECYKVLHNFNLVNTNAMGYVLDAENETIMELIKLNKIHKRFLNEEDIYTRILSKMTENFNSQVEDLLQTTRQDLRLAAGDTYLQYGCIKNITTWQEGDPVVRENGFSHDKASRDKMKTLQRMQEAFGDGSQVALDANVNEAKYIYYMKLLQDMEDSERDELQQQLARDRTQALAEYSLLEPPFKPDGCLAWKTIGVSCNSIIWKMYNTVDCVSVTYKMRLLNNATSDVAMTIQRAYEAAIRIIERMNINLPDSRQIKFAKGVDVTFACVVERMDLIRDIPVSELIEKPTQMTQGERFAQAQVIVREITKLLYQLQGINFVLPLKSSRVYLSSGGVTLLAGVPRSLINAEARELLKQHEKTTIASLLWTKNIEWYLPPEAQGDMAFTRDTVAVSKAHTWMIGKILYEATCQTPISKVTLDYNKIELCEDEATREFLKLCLDENVNTRPTIEDIIRHPFMKKHRLNYGAFGPIDVGKAQCAVEILGDIETIVLNKINRTEKGVADYEQNEKWDAMLCESSEEDLRPLGNKYTYNFPNYDRAIGFKK